MLHKIYKPIKYFFEAIVFILFFLLFKVIGRRLSSDLSCWLMQKWGPLFKSESTALSNLKIAFKDLPPTEAKKICKAMWCNYGRCFSEYAFFKQFRNSNHHIHVQNGDYIKQLAPQQKLLFFSGHFAAFELIAMEISKLDVEHYVLYRPLNNFFLDPIIKFLRQKYTSPLLIPKALGKKQSATKQLINTMRKGQNLSLMVDQKVSEGILVDFFDQQALTTIIPARCALKYGYTLIPIHLKRTNAYQFSLQFLNPVTINDDDDEVSLTKRLNVIIEKMVIDAPKDWIWTHKRWKT